MLIRALMLLALACAVPGGPGAGAPATRWLGSGIVWAQQEAPPSLAEVRAIAKVRDQRADGNFSAQVAAAQAYLKQFPKGRYADEAQYALADGMAGDKKPQEALAAYDRLQRDFPGSAFSDQATVASLTLLQATGQQDQALELVDRFTSEHPASTERGRAWLWKAQVLFGQEKYAETVTVLGQFAPSDELSPQDQGNYSRLLGLSYWRTGNMEQGRPLLTRYVKQEGTGESKAQVLLLLGQEAEQRHQSELALGYYQQVVERYPVPAALPEAQYRRADLYANTFLGASDDELAQARLKQAVAYYGAYLDGSDAHFRGPALERHAALLMQAGRDEEALTDYNRLIALGDPYRNSTDLLVARVSLLKKLKRDDDAIAALAGAVLNTGLALQVRLGLLVDQAALEYDHQRCPKVEALLQPMPVFGDPALRTKALFMRGFCRYKSAVWEKASLDLEELAEDPAYQAVVVPALMESYEKSAQYARLARLMEEQLVANRLDPSEQNLQQLAHAYESTGEPGKILQVYHRLEEVNPQSLLSPGIQLSMGIAEEAQGNSNVAAGHYEAVLALTEKSDAAPGPAYMGALERLQPLYRRDGRHADLVALNKRALAAIKDPTQAAQVKILQARAYLEWGLAQAKGDDPAQALKSLEQAKALTSPADGDLRVEVLIALAQVYDQNKQQQRGVQLYKAELTHTKDSAQRARLISALLANNLDWGDALAKHGDLDDAIHFYRQSLDQLPKDRVQERYGIILKLDPLYRAKGNFEARVALYAGIADEPAMKPLRDQISVYRADLLQQWAKSEAGQGKPDLAAEKYRQAVALLPAAEWRRRYELTAAVGHLYLKQQQYTDLVLAYEDMLPEIKDDKLSAEVRKYLGQLHLDWGGLAEKDGNLKSAGIRYYRALDYLPDTDPEDRATAGLLLASVLVRQERKTQAAQMLTGLCETLPAGQPLQKAELALARLNRDELQNDAQARVWLQKADVGGVDVASLEAGYTLAEMDIKAGAAQAATERLQSLAGRPLGDSPWSVPIHYRLAVEYHRREALTEALAQYKLVAGAKSGAAHAQYAQAIAQSKSQVQALENYLRLTGGAAGAKIEVPKVQSD